MRAKFAQQGAQATLRFAASHCDATLRHESYLAPIVSYSKRVARQMCGVTLGKFAQLTSIGVCVQ